MFKKVKRILFTAASVLTALFICLSPAGKSGLCITGSASGINTAITLGDGYTTLKMSTSDSTHRIYYTIGAGKPKATTKEYNGGKLRFTSPKILRLSEKNDSGKTVYTKDLKIEVRLPTPTYVLRDNLDGTASIWFYTQDKNAKIVYSKDGGKNFTYKKAIKVKMGRTVTAHCEREDYNNSYDITINVGDFVTERSYSDYIEKALKETNKVRAKLDLPALKLDKTLSSAAYLRAKEICEDYSIIHTRLGTGEPWYTILDEVGFAYSHAAENIQYLDGRGIAPEYAVNKWVDSPDHFSNIISCENDRVGFAFVQKNGKCFWVQIFGKKL